MYFERLWLVLFLFFFKKKKKTNCILNICHVIDPLFLKDMIYCSQCWICRVYSQTADISQPISAPLLKIVHLFIQSGNLIPSCINFSKQRLQYHRLEKQTRILY